MSELVRSVYQSCSQYRPYVLGCAHWPKVSHEARAGLSVSSASCWGQAVLKRGQLLPEASLQKEDLCQGESTHRKLQCAQSHFSVCGILLEDRPTAPPHTHTLAPQAGSQCLAWGHGTHTHINRPPPRSMVRRCLLLLYPLGSLFWS